MIRKNILSRYFQSFWLPTQVYVAMLAPALIAMLVPWLPAQLLALVLFAAAGVAFLGIIAAGFWNLKQKRNGLGFANLFMGLACAVLTFIAFAVVMFASMFGPIEDGFADNLAIPEGIVAGEPERELAAPVDAAKPMTGDPMREAVRKALAVPGTDDPQFAPNLPSLRRASTAHLDAFAQYVEASLDWNVFIEQGNRFASRRWSHRGEPRDTMHGYISDFDVGGNARFQTRCLLCLDKKPWSRYKVQHIPEQTTPVHPEMGEGNRLHESRVMIECGGVWVEIFEQSDAPERRVTKATLAQLESEFAGFLNDPQAAVAEARARNQEWARRLPGDAKEAIRLLHGMQPGMYGAVYTLNPGESGSVYLKAFEVTKGTPLSVERLKPSSTTRMAWSPEANERFAAKAGFTIYEGDWGKPYAARFEAWFKPDSGAPERKLAERIFKIEGWQR